MQWLYFKSLGLTKAVRPKTSEGRYTQLAKLHTLADEFDVGLLKNSIIDELFALQMTPDVSPPQPPAVSYIYENTTETSSLRKLIVGWYAWHIEYDWYTTSGTLDFLEDTPMFAAEPAMAMSQRVQDRNLKSPFCSEPSSYYEDHLRGSGD